MGCCDNTAKQSEKEIKNANDVRERVREGYAKVAQEGAFTAIATGSAGGCCGPNGGYSAEELAKQIGYTAQEIQNLPEGANMGLSCGNPNAIANLKPGQVVVDLGSGGGFDAFLAGPKVGNSGRVIGVDMTPEMLSKARKNLESYRKRTGFDNVEFRLGEIEHLPLADSSADVIISNCVINLSPDKPQVWREIFRVLKPGGTIAVSDMALLKPLPEKVANRVEALVGCIAGAVEVNEYRQMIERAGLKKIRLLPKPEYVETLMNFKDPLYQGIAKEFDGGQSAADYITSMDVTAVKE